MAPRKKEGVTIKADDMWLLWRESWVVVRSLWRPSSKSWSCKRVLHCPRSVRHVSQKKLQCTHEGSILPGLKHICQGLRRCLVFQLGELRVWYHARNQSLQVRTTNFGNHVVRLLTYLASAPAYQVKHFFPRVQREATL